MGFLSNIQFILFSCFNKVSKISNLVGEIPWQSEQHTNLPRERTLCLRVLKGQGSFGMMESLAES